MTSFAKLLAPGTPDYEIAMEAGTTARTAEITKQIDVLTKKYGEKISFSDNASLEEKYRIAKSLVKAKYPSTPQPPQITRTLQFPIPDEPVSYEQWLNRGRQ